MLTFSRYELNMRKIDPDWKISIGGDLLKAKK